MLRRLLVVPARLPTSTPSLLPPLSCVRFLSSRVRACSLLLLLASPFGPARRDTKSANSNGETRRHHADRTAKEGTHDEQRTGRLATHAERECFPLSRHLC